MKNQLQESTNFCQHYFENIRWDIFSLLKLEEENIISAWDTFTKLSELTKLLVPQC